MVLSAGGFKFTEPLNLNDYRGHIDPETALSADRSRGVPLIAFQLNRLMYFLSIVMVWSGFYGGLLGTTDTS